MSSNIYNYYTKGEKSDADEQTSNRESFAKMSRLDVCKPIRLHNTFLLKYNNNKQVYRRRYESRRSSKPKLH